MEEVLLYKADDGTLFSTAEEARKRDKRHKRNTENELLRKAVMMTTKVRYELANGVHTRHECPYCKQRGTRAGKCFMCLVEEFADENL